MSQKSVASATMPRVGTLEWPELAFRGRPVTLSSRSESWTSSMGGVQDREWKFRLKPERTEHDAAASSRAF